MLSGSKRIVELDYAKGIGIFLVVFRHMMILQNDYSAVEKFLAVCINSFTMPLFLIISGIVTGIRATEMKIEKTARQRLIPYLCWSIIYVVCNFFGNPDWLSSTLERGYACLSGRGIAPLWFLAALFLAEALSEMLLRLLKRSGFSHEVGIIVEVCLFLLLSEAAFLLYGCLPPAATTAEKLVEYPLISVVRTFPAALFFCIGRGAGRHWDKIREHRWPIMAGSLILFSVAQGITQNSTNMHLFSFDSMAVFVITGISGTFAVIGFCCILPCGLKILERAGKGSLDIMALHYPPLPIYRLLYIGASRIGIEKAHILLTIVVFAACYAIHWHIIEKARGHIMRAKVCS